MHGKLDAMLSSWAALHQYATPLKVLISPPFFILNILVLRTIFLLFFHPLSAYPGPKLWAICRIPWIRHSLRGELAFKIRDLHDQYGPVVRIAPDELSYTSSAAWKEIYGKKNPEFEKCLDGRGVAPRSLEGVKGIINEDQEKHSRLRRAINPAFSERAIREQEVFLQLYSDKLVSCLLRDAKKGEAVDILRWVHLTTFDVISDLAFGQPAGCLDNADQPWLQIIGARAKAIVWHQFEMIYNIDRMLHKIWPTRFSEVRRKHIELTTAKVLRRIQQENQKDHKDFMSYILDNETENLTRGELIIMASAFIVAGSGTVGAAVSGAIFHLCRNPRAYQLLVEEIRGRFSSGSEITIQSTSELRYLKAVIEESLRIYPPSPSTLPRFVPGEGQMIEGKWVPGGIAVGVHPLSACHLESNFRHARSFIPERWLKESADEFANDDKGAAQAFSFGERNCIGKSLAYAEIRLLLSKIFFNLDLKLVDNSDTWFNSHKTYLVWEKIPLMVNIRSRSDDARGLRYSNSKVQIDDL